MLSIYDPITSYYVFGFLPDGRIMYTKYKRRALTWKTQSDLNLLVRRIPTIPSTHQIINSENGQSMELGHRKDPESNGTMS